MCGHNQTDVTEFVLLGFKDLHHFKGCIFSLFLILYVTTLMGNILIISLIASNKTLSSPMYHFLCNLSLCEIIFTTIVMPNMLYVVWGDGGPMSFYGCITQFYLGASVGSVECLLLTVMAYDRYLAICNPLRYSSIMNTETQNLLALGSWISGFMAMVILTVSICKLQFCGFNTIDHLFCDLAPLLQLSSADTFLVEMESVVLTIAFSLFPFVLILLSYISIVFTLVRISSRTNRQKSFSTCSAHLASVCTYFGSIFIIYLVPSQKHSMEFNKLLSLFYTIGTPLLNPVIYSLRNQEIKSCILAYITPKVLNAPMINMRN